MAKRQDGFDPKRTMKLDVSDVTLEPDPEWSEAAPSTRKGPPPLPPSERAPVSAVSEVQPAPRNKWLYGAIFAVMLVAAAIGGRVFADFVRGAPPAASASAAPASAPDAPPVASAGTTATASAAPTMTLPTVEIH